MGIKNQKLLKKEIESLKEDLDGLERYIEDFSSFLPLPICIINFLGFIADANKAFESLMGLGRLEIIGKDLKDFFSEKSKFEKMLEEIEKQKIIQDKEFVVITKTKEQIPVRVSCAGRREEGGTYVGSFVAIVNIRELKDYQRNLEEQVKERTKKLEEKIEELERINRLTVGRELKMIELKKEIERLKEELEKYKGRQ